MKIQDGGAVSNLKSKSKIEHIRFVVLNDYKFEMWINDDCLSYVSITELLQLKDEIQTALEKSIK